MAPPAGGFGESVAGDAAGASDVGSVSAAAAPAATAAAAVRAPISADGVVLVSAAGSGVGMAVLAFSASSCLVR